MCWPNVGELPDVTESGSRDGPEAIGLTTNPVKGALVSIRWSEHRLSALMNGQGIKRVIAVTPETERMTKFMQSRGFKHLSSSDDTITSTRGSRRNWPARTRSAT